MKGVRFFGLIFTGIFAFGCGLIGYAFTTGLYLQLPYVRNSSPYNGYDNVAIVAFSLVGALGGFLLGTILYRRIIEIGRGLKRIPAEDKIAAMLGTIISLIPTFMFGMLIWNWIHDLTVRFALLTPMSVPLIRGRNVPPFGFKEEVQFFPSST